MTTARAAFLALLLVICAPSHSNDLTSEKKADIERLLQMTGALSIGQQMSTAIVNQMTNVIRKARPDIPQRVLDVLPQEVNAVIAENLPAFREAVVPLYHKHFTGEEIKEMIRFYSTDLGQKTIRVLPMLVGEGMQAGQRWGQSLGPVIEQRIKARLTKEGYSI